MSQELDQHYLATLENIKEKIRQAQFKAAVTVNFQLLQLYWEIGKVISEKETAHGWGARVVELLSADLRREFPGKKGYSSRNLRYMRDFANAYSDFLILPQPVAKLPWSHIRMLLDKFNDPAQRNFYAEKAIENGWSRSILQIQIESQLHRRVGQAITNFSDTLPDIHSDLAREIFKNPYVFNFLSLDEKVKERELEKALLQNITKFLLELGAGFAFVGQQVPLDLEGEEFFPDLIFYHIRLRCYVVVDLKMKDFKAEYAGKMGFYLSIFDNQWRSENDNPSIGLLLCKGANKVIAEYAVQALNKPIGVSSFIVKGEPMPEEFIDALPSPELIAAKIEEYAKK